MIRAERGRVVRPGRVSFLSMITVRVEFTVYVKNMMGVERTSVGRTSVERTSVWVL